MSDLESDIFQYNMQFFFKRINIITYATKKIHLTSPSNVFSKGRQIELTRNRTEKNWVSANITFHKGSQFWEEANSKIKGLCSFDNCSKYAYIQSASGHLLQKIYFFFLFFLLFFSARSNSRKRTVHAEKRKERNWNHINFIKGYLFVFA